jgi:hypothetical protein
MVIVINIVITDQTLGRNAPGPKLIKATSLYCHSPELSVWNQMPLNTSHHMIQRHDIN